jgi:hypothetical protein
MLVAVLLVVSYNTVGVFSISRFNSVQLNTLYNPPNLSLFFSSDTCGSFFSFFLFVKKRAYT